MKLDRREVLAGLALGGLGIPGQNPAETDRSLYIPQSHLVDDRKLLHDFMDEYPFVELVTPLPTLRITHIPVFLDRTAGPNGTIFGHLSRQNPQSRTFDGEHSAVAVFRGAHGYISPTWLARTDGVPTWNFAVVHASGHPKAISEPEEKHALLAKMIDTFEKFYGSGYDFSKVPEETVSSLMAGIVGFEMPLGTLEGKFKLGQGMTDADKRSVLEHLRQAGKREPSLQELSEKFYGRPESK